ncbi:RDD family protein [Luteimonas sp. MC1825]|uniref:RDD family protein n=1 Tax=Luteimonas sp. MC1825 TaxID=2761107 RepID=UPI001614E71E|nr:RDD family protein [Luteimonas sp. MC1825]MBB6600488.1 RDD family protein [Luteimonas sp. MC1825]QOC88150.1 RDD family protein [Luteimonas sp. MC1825]
MRPAGFWRRAAAWSLDAALVALPVLGVVWNPLRRSIGALGAATDTLLEATALRMADALQTLESPLALAQGWLRDPELLAAAHGVESALSAMLLPPLAAFVVAWLAWCVGFERTPWQATPGKRALGLRVVDAAGQPPGIMSLLVRFLAGGLSWLTLNLGHLLAALPPRHAALHDRISRTRVCLADDAPARMPGWAGAWLWLLAAATLAANIWLVSAAGGVLRAALQRAPG